MAIGIEISTAPAAKHVYQLCGFICYMMQESVSDLTD